MQKGYFRKTIQPIERCGYNISGFSDDDSLKNGSDKDTRKSVKTTPLT